MDINKQLAEWIWYPGAPYPEPAHIMSADAGPAGQAPWTMQGFNFQSMLGVTVSAPALAKAVPEFHTALVLPNTVVIGSGQAPTSGIYTGVEDSCG